MIFRVFACYCLALLSAAASAAVVTLDAGLLEGKQQGGVSRYLGVPYAAPPVGELRWRAPQAVSPWRGVRKAHEYADACTQIGGFFASNDQATFDKPYGSEDCLYLNVWVPESGAQARPVLVFFHGGAGVAGTAAHPMYDGETLAKETGAVVITANYRLGVWGSLQSPALQTGNAAEDSGSFYLLDMIQVLDWARQNCQPLGCDPSNITISGQSAGAVAVLALLRSPLAEGKFQKAISFSGLPFSASMGEAEERTDVLLTSLLINDGLAENKKAAARLLASMSPEQLRDYLYAKSSEDLLRASGRGLHPLAVDDGTVLMALNKADKLAAKAVSVVPLLIGKTRDEMTTLVPIKGIGRNANQLWPLFDGEPREETINQKLGWFAGLNRGIKISMSSWALDRRFKKILDSYAESLPIMYAYQFEWADYPDPWRSELGALHGLDIPFIFGNFIDDRKSYMRFAWTEENAEYRAALHQQIVRSIKAFVHTGDPNIIPKKPWLPWWGKEEQIERWGR